MNSENQESPTDSKNTSFGLPGVASVSANTVLTLKYGVVEFAGHMTQGMPSK